MSQSLMLLLKNVLNSLFDQQNSKFGGGGGGET